MPLTARSCLALTAAAWSLAASTTCTASDGRACNSQTAGGLLVQLNTQATKDGGSKRMCPATEQGVCYGDVTTSQLDECSGLAASRVNPGLYWADNDSGAGPNLYGIDRNGQHKARLYVHGSGATDWEDIAVGPGPEDGASYVYIADTGDNYRNRGNVQIYRVREPQVPEGRDRNDDIHVSAERFDLNYPDGSHDCEALFIDQGPSAKARGTAGRVYIITKGDNKNADPRWKGGDVYFVDLPISPSGSLTFTKTEVRLNVEWVTGADLSPDGQLIVVRSYGEVLMWPHGADMSVETSLAGNSCVVNKKDERQGEAVAFGVDSDHYITVSEGNYPPVWYFGFSESYHEAMLKMASIESA